MGKSKNNLAVCQGGWCRQIETLIGVFKALEDNKITFTNYRASSAGAIIASFLSSGVSIDHLVDLIKTTNLADYFRLKLFSKAVMDKDKLYEFLQTYITKKASEEVLVSVTCLDTEESKMVPATPLSVLASIAHPVFMEPVEIDNLKYADGGILNNTPVPKINDFRNYDNIYIILMPYCETKERYKKINKNSDVIEITMFKDSKMVYQLGLHELSNVTIIQPPPIDGDFMTWSENLNLIHHAYNYTDGLIFKNKH